MVKLENCMMKVTTTPIMIAKLESPRELSR